MLNRHSKALNNEIPIPDDWRKSVIVSIPKKGNSTALDNQRGIAKTCSSAKLFNNVLLSRLKPIIDPQLSQCQSGFRAGRSTTEQVMALRFVIDTCRVTNMTASLVFVDFRQAFDTLHRSSIPVILSQYNVPICLISYIAQMYSDTSACVSSELGPTEWFKTTSGVLQGDTLSPYLFFVLLDNALKKTLQDDVGFVVCKRNGRRHPATHIGALAYADDICLLAESIDDVECSLHRHETSAAEIGLTINYNKTKEMHLGQTSARHVRFANGDPVDSCDKFEYLGVPTSNAETVFRSRLSKAWAATTKLRSIFNSQANDSIKIGLCRSTVESILLYGLEYLPLTLTLQDKLNSAYRRILRYALGVHFPVCISNAELTRSTGATALSKTLRQRRLRLVGHALRMANPSPLAILLRFLQPGIRRRRGQARTLTLHQNIIDDISAINQNVKSITSASSSYFNRIVATLSTN